MPRQKKVKLIGLGVPANLLKEFIDLSYKGNTSIAPAGYEIDTPLSDSRVKVYTKPNSKEVIVTHRGSVGLQDWLDNAKFLVAGKVKSTKTYKMHRERHLKAIEKYGAENIIGIGHSRAGLYLQELQKEVPIKEIITYNKAVGFYDALRTNPAEQTDVKVKNDFVSLLSGLQKRPKKMVEIEATKNPLDFNAAHQPKELEKLGETFIGLENEPMEGSGRAPTPKTLEQLKKILKTLEGKLEKINKGKVYKTTNKEKVEYELSYTKARIKNHETKGEDLIITKKKKYGNELPAKAKAYKAKAVKPKAVKPKAVKPKEVKPKEEPKKQLLLDYKEIIEPTKTEPIKAEPIKTEPKKEEPKSVKKGKSIKTADEVKNEYIKIFLEGDLEWINEALINVTNIHDFDILNNDDRMKQMKNAQTRVFRNKYFKEQFIDKYNSLDNCKEIMCKYGINNKAQFRKWIVRNHPDKGGTIGDTEFKQLIKCAIKEKYCKPEPKMIVKELEPKKTGGIFGFSAEEKEARKKEKAEKRAKFDAEKKARSEKMKEFTEALNALKKKKQAKKEADEAPKAETEPKVEIDAEIEPIEGGIFGFSDKEKADKAEFIKLRSEYYKTHTRQQNANYTFDKKARAKWKKEFYAKNTAPKAKEIVEVPKAEEDAEQQEITESEPIMEGSGYRKSYIEEIANPVNPMFAFKSTLSVPMFIEPESDYLITDENYYGGSAADMLGMNCYDGKCFNPVWEKEKIKRQILSEYKIWYWPWGTPPAGHIRMPWLNAMVEDRYKPLYDEFVARRNVNIGLDANASKDDFGRQMFSNLTDALSYVPVLNLPTTIALSAASAVADIKKEPVEPIEPEPIEPNEIDTD